MCHDDPFPKSTLTCIVLSNFPVAVENEYRIISSPIQASAINLIPIPDQNNLPIGYHLALMGKEAQARDSKYLNEKERFMFTNKNGILIFASNMNLQILHDPEYWIADGTFELRPTIFAQIYTVHDFIQNEDYVAKWNLAC
uniref:Uncharacterized protein n=1 Tax=Romanomermis culicivorax TaxID=13658 RepID=A0A915IGU5_ROMCU